jgi:TnpA family transposase
MKNLSDIVLIYPYVYKHARNSMLSNNIIFFGKGVEIATNRMEDQEIAVLSLHLLQNCLVYVNTLMLQQVLSEKE